MIAVEAIGVTKSYVRKHLFKKITHRGVMDFSMQVQTGEVYGLLGLNGAGKTTTMKLLVGLIFPDKGEIKVLGQNVQQIPLKNKIGYVPELPYLPLYLTAEETLNYYGKLYDGDRRRIKERIRSLIDKLNLSGFINRRLSEYSKGMLQRIALAQALIKDPEIVFFDEPMSGLDPLGYKEMRDILIDLKHEGKTIIFNSHLLSEVEKICDRIGIIADGKLVDQTFIRDIKKKKDSLEQHFIKVIGKAKNSDSLGNKRICIK